MRTMHATVTDARTITGRITAGLGVLCAALAFIAAPPARADDASYLASLNASGVPIPLPDNVRLASGRYVCGQLRMRGISAPIQPQELVRQLTNVFLYSPEAAQVQIDAAQSELCPETLRR